MKAGVSCNHCSLVPMLKLIQVRHACNCVNTLLLLFNKTLNLCSYASHFDCRTFRNAGLGKRAFFPLSSFAFMCPIVVVEKEWARGSGIGIPTGGHVLPLGAAEVAYMWEHYFCNYCPYNGHLKFKCRLEYCWRVRGKLSCLTVGPLPCIFPDQTLV